MKSCPDEPQLQRLLDDTLAPAERSALQTHLDQCRPCQQTLERLTDDPLLGRRRRAAPPPANAAHTSDLSAPASQELPALAFLAPASRPEALGRLGHYEVLQVLGRGGFGIVLRAFDEVLQRVVAIKVLAPALAATSPARQRFLREARAAAQVRHENVVQIHAVAEQPLPYLVMEYIPGETLQQRLERTGPFGAAEVAVIGRQIAEGLEAARQAGLIHRDIKPANVLVEPGPRLRVKVTDFGLARAADDASLTQSGVVAGTPLYMSPEQAKGERLDHRSDLFSLGSVLYAITAGRPPFRAGNTLAVLKRVAEDAPRPIPEIIPETPAWLDGIIGKLLAKDPEQRFQTAAAVSAALETGTAPPTRASARRIGRRLPRLAVRTLLAGSVAGAAVLGWWASDFLGGSPGLGLARPPRDRAPAPTPPAPAAPVAAKKSRLGAGFRFDRLGAKTTPAASRDGKLLAAPCGPAVFLFDCASGEAVRTLDSPSGDVRGVSFSPDGQRLAAYSTTLGKVRVWSLADDQVLFTRDADGSTHIEPVFSPDGKLLVVGENRPLPRLRVLDAFTGAEVKVIPTATCYGGKFNATGTRFAALFRNPSGVSDTHPDQEKVTVWDTATWGQVGTLTHPAGRDGGTPSFVQYSPGGKYLAASGTSGIAVWKADTQELVNTVHVPCFWFDFLADDQTLVVQSTEDFRPDHQFVRYDIASGAEKGTFTVNGPRDYLYVSLDPARPVLLVAPYTTGSRIRLFEPLTGQERFPGEPATSAPKP